VVGEELQAVGLDVGAEAVHLQAIACEEQGGGGQRLGRCTSAPVLS
jgi:hypothetical protein